jgi:predicted transglutaminase-like cysteine proteinase
VRPTTTILTIAIALTVTASAMQEDAGAALYAGPPQSVFVGISGQIALDSSWPSPAAQPVWPMLAAYEPSFDLKAGESSKQPAFYGYSFQPDPKAAPSQSVSLEPPAKVEPARPSVEITRPSQVAPSRPSPRPMPLGDLRRSNAPIVHIAFNSTVLGPMAHTRFCLTYPSECKVRKMMFRGGAIKLTAERRAELMKVNTEVNRSIRPEPNTEGLAAEKWLIAPSAGECHDYAVTKRHELIARGWPARVLLLAEVIIASGEHHLVLVVRTHDGDLVADSLNANIRSWAKTDYQWVRVQTPANPLYWATVTRSLVYAQLR